jgi:RNA polymerase sigma factor (sigma-70 family)
MSWSSNGGGGASARHVQGRLDGQFDAVLEAGHRGESWAFDQIFRALAPRVAAYLGAQGCAEPDDVTSEVFLGVLRNITRFRGDEAAFRSWVFTIAHRRLTDERRRIGRRPAFEPLTAAVEMGAPDDVEDTVIRSLGTDRVRALCERLGRGQRDVLLLRLVAQLTVEDVATVLDKTPGAVKALQRRGFRSIRRVLEQERVRL